MEAATANHADALKIIPYFYTSNYKAKHYNEV